MLFLDGETIRASLSCEEAMGAVEEALLIQESGHFSMPDRLGMDCGKEGNKLLLMPCQTELALGTKLVSVFPSNRGSARPAIDGVVVLNDPKTGEVLAILDGKSLTAIRTGALTGVSLRYLAPQDAHSLGLVGCGVQAFDQVRHACAARPIREVLLHSRSSKSRDDLARRLTEELPHVSVRPAASLEAMLAVVQVVITSTSAREPVLPDKPALFEGKHCVAIGSFEPTVREYPDAIFARTAKVWVDTPQALVESGELAIPLARGLIKRDQIQTLGNLIKSGAPPDRGHFGTTFFKSVGMALLDICTASLVRRNTV